LRYRKGLVEAARADALSVTAFEVGLVAWMVVIRLVLFPRPHPDSPVYWFATSLPGNAWLTRRGIKEAMEARRADASAGHDRPPYRPVLTRPATTVEPEPCRVGGLLKDRVERNDQQVTPPTCRTGPAGRSQTGHAVAAVVHELHPGGIADAPGLQLDDHSPLAGVAAQLESGSGRVDLVHGYSNHCIEQ
jgi:hypothetical protein